MTCPEAREHFSARADDALSAAELAAVDAHLAGCVECRREWQRFAATLGLLRAVEPARAPAGFVDRVLAAARPQPWYRRLAHGLWVPWTVKLPLEAAAVVMIAGLAVLIFQRSSELQLAARPPQTAEEMPVPDERTQVSELTPNQEVDAVRSTARAKTPAPAAPTAPDAQFAPAVPPAPAAPPAAAPPAATAPTLADSRMAPTAESRDEARRESAPPRIAQQQAGEPAMARRQQSATAPAAPGARSDPAFSKPSSIAATAPAAESSGEARAKQQDRLAKEAERKTEKGDDQVKKLSARVPPSVELSLAVADRAGAQAAIVGIVERLGGALVTGPTPGALEIMVPRETFTAFSAELARLGTLRIVRQPTDLPENIRIGLQLTP